MHYYKAASMEEV